MEDMGPRQTDEVGEGMPGRGKEHWAKGLDTQIPVLPSICNVMVKKEVTSLLLGFLSSSEKWAGSLKLSRSVEPQS